MSDCRAGITTAPPTAAAHTATAVSNGYGDAGDAGGSEMDHHKQQQSPPTSAAADDDADNSTSTATAEMEIEVSSSREGRVVDRVEENGQLIVENGQDTTMAAVVAAVRVRG